MLLFPFHLLVQYQQQESSCSAAEIFRSFPSPVEETAESPLTPLPPSSIYSFAPPPLPHPPPPPPSTTSLPISLIHFSSTTTTSMTTKTTTTSASSALTRTTTTTKAESLLELQRTKRIDNSHILASKLMARKTPKGACMDRNDRN